MRRCAVLGDPVAHSLSPALHRAAYAYLGLPWQYERHRVSADDVADFVANLDSTWRGLSCTMPLKEAIVGLGQPDQLVSDLGVGNTVVFDGRPGDPSTTRIANTDVAGLADALTAAGAAGSTTAVILGNGATARSAVCALSLLGVTSISVVARDQQKTETLSELGKRYQVEVVHQQFDGALSPVDVAVSTVPAAVAEVIAAKVAAAARFVFDVVYDPWPTPLAEQAAAHDRGVINGLDLLAHQAVGQIKLFTGQSVPAELLVTAGQEALLERHQA